LGGDHFDIGQAQQSNGAAGQVGAPRGSVQEKDLTGWPSNGERQPRKPYAGADIEERGGWPGCVIPSRGEQQGIGHVARVDDTRFRRAQASSGYCFLNQPVGKVCKKT